MKLLLLSLALLASCAKHPLAVTPGETAYRITRSDGAQLIVIKTQDFQTAEREFCKDRICAVELIRVKNIPAKEGKK